MGLSGGGRVFLFLFFPADEKSPALSVVTDRKLAVLIGLVNGRAPGETSGVYS